MRAHLALHEVTKVYGSANTAVMALDNVSLEVGTGEMVAVMGTSRSVSSTR